MVFISKLMVVVVVSAVFGGAISADGFLQPFSPSCRLACGEGNRCTTQPLASSNGGVDPPVDNERAKVCLTGVSKDDPDLEKMIESLNNRGFEVVDILSSSEDVNSNIVENNEKVYVYKYKKSTGMMVFVSGPSSSSHQQQTSNARGVPRWIPLLADMETVLITNGWSFLDPDESEPISAFDIDAANLEGQYKPKWGQFSTESNMGDENGLCISSIGYDLKTLNHEDVMYLSTKAINNDLSRTTLLEGGTDPPNLKRTHNNYAFIGPAGQSDIPKGIFCCAIGSLPLFSSLDLVPISSSSGWLSFSKPISSDHITLIQPEPDANDQRVEVVCAKSQCHLGHYFGQGEGFCINASGLNFFEEGLLSSSPLVTDVLMLLASPVSWRQFETYVLGPSQLQLNNILRSLIKTNKIAVGGGCFWHIEAAMRRLPGVVDTSVGYAGGIKDNPSYEEVCHEDTRHAEVVMVEYDPNVLSSRRLIEAFLALHDPTKVRAHGKHAKGTGQYRSCIFVLDDSDPFDVASMVLKECEKQLHKQLSTELHFVASQYLSTPWFWRAEDRHQRREERRCNDNGAETATLSFDKWIKVYGRREQSVVGSAETINYSVGT